MAGAPVAAREWPVEGRARGALADYRPSQDWEVAGPIIAREQISICCDSHGWLAHKGYGLWQSYLATGDNALQAAMRCYVISRFGDTYSGENPEGK